MIIIALLDWLIDWLINTWHGFLKSTIYYVSQSLSQVIKIYICQIFGKEKWYSWHLDKKSNYILFGSRTYMFLDQEMIEKGIGIKWMKFGTRTASPQIPDVSGMHTERVRYEWGYKTAGTPLSKLVFPPSSQPSHLSSTFIGDFKFPLWKGREGDWIGGDLH